MSAHTNARLKPAGRARAVARVAAGERVRVSGSVVRTETATIEAGAFTHWTNSRREILQKVPQQAPTIDA